MQRNDPASGEAQGRVFRLINRATGESEDVWVPFDGPRPADDLIIGTSHVLFVGDPAGCVAYIRTHPSARSGRIASAYVLPDGRVVLLVPHRHDQVARQVLPKLLVPRTHDYNREFLASLNSTLMPLYTGTLRVQLLPDGIGISIETVRPPNKPQVSAVQNYYDLTTRQVFVVEVYYNTTLLAWLRSFPDLDRLLKTFPDGQRSSPDAILDFLRHLGGLLA